MFSSSQTPPIYLDYNASTPISENVKLSIMDILDVYGNPSSTHSMGMLANKILEDSRENIAEYLHIDPRHMVFTSGATESNNIIFNSHDGLIITAMSEHSSIVNSIKARKEKGCILPICSAGHINLNLLENKLKEEQGQANTQPILLSLALVNGVNGVIAPIEAIMALVEKYQILIHWDCTQALGKMPLDMDKLNPDYLVASGHKLGALKGVGILYYKSQIKTMSHGGGQELGVRSGTENILAIHSLSQAITHINIPHYHQHTSQLIDHIHKKITDSLKIDNIKQTDKHNEIFLFSRYSKVNTIQSINNTIILAMKNKTSAQQFMLFDMAGFCLSIGSACTSSKTDANNWLEPQEISDTYKNLSQSILRISIGLQTTKEEIDSFIDKWLSIYLST